jgi:hypothetical protein
MKPLKHALIAQKRYGGQWSDYLGIHTFFDTTKAAYAGRGHRMFLHQDFGVRCAERIFGLEAINSDGVRLKVADLGNDHLVEDVGRVPTIQDWLDRLPALDWVRSPARISSYCDYREDPVAAAKRRYGGPAEAYAPIVEFFDEPMALTGGNRLARLVTHNSFMIFIAERIFGMAIDAGGKPVSTRQVAEDLIMARYGFIPTLQDIAKDLKRDAWAQGRYAGHGIKRRKAASPTKSRLEEKQPA